MKRRAYHRRSLIYYDSVRLALYASMHAILSTVLQLLTLYCLAGQSREDAAVRRQETREISCPAGPRHLGIKVAREREFAIARRLAAELTRRYFSLKARAMLSVNGDSMYPRAVRAPVLMSASTGMPGCSTRSPRLWSCSLDTSMRAR